MSIYDLKPGFQNLLRPLCRRMASAGITANQVTVSALVLSVVVGILILYADGAPWSLLLVPIALLIRMGLNAIDGMLAREHNMKSALGALLNELGDVVSDTAIYLPFVAVPGIPDGVMVLVVVLAVISEMAGVVAVQIGSSRRYEGPMGKSDRAAALGIIALLLGLGVPAGQWLPIAVTLIAVLLVITIVRRARCALLEVS